VKSDIDNSVGCASNVAFTALVFCFESRPLKPLISSCVKGQSRCHSQLTGSVEAAYLALPRVLHNLKAPTESARLASR